VLDWRDPLLVPCHWQAELFYCRWRTKAIDDCSNSNYATDILTLKRFEICRQLLSFLTLCLCEPGVNTTFRVLNLDWLYWQMLTLNSSTIFCVADMVIHFGRYGIFVWMMWLWPIWSVADMVQTRLCWTVFTRNRDTAVCSQPMFVCLLIFGCLWVFLAAFLCPVCVVVNVYSFPFLLFMFYLSGE